METDRFILKNGKLVIKEGVTRVKSFEFEDLDVYQVILPNGLEVIEPYSFYNHSIEYIEFNQDIEEIGKCAFQNNRLKEVVLPNSIKKIGESAFENNLIKKVILPDNLLVLQKKTFKNNKIKSIIFNEKLQKIEEEALYQNTINALKLNENLSVIENSAFEKNAISNIIFNEELIEIGKKAFKQNKIKEVTLSSKLTELKDEVFMYNAIEILNLNDNLKIIGKSCFLENKIKALFCNKNLEIIKEEAFSSNKIENLVLNEGLITIESRAFFNNKINYLSLPNTLQVLEKESFISNKIKELNIGLGLSVLEEDVFCDNKLENIIIPSNIKTIKDGAFLFNNFETVEFECIPDFIGLDAFRDTLTTIEGIQIPSAEIKKFGAHNLIKLYAFKIHMKDFDVLTIDKKDLDLLHPDLKTLKGYKSNYKQFNNFKKEVFEKYSNLNHVQNYNNFFKLVQSIGMFTSNNFNKDKLIILEFLETLKKDELKEMFDQSDIIITSPKIKELMIDYLKQPNKYLAFFKEALKEFDTVYNSIIKNKKYKIFLNNKEKNKLIRENINVNDLVNVIEYQKKNIKSISMQNVLDYYKSHIYDIKPENNALENISLYLSPYVNKDEFRRIEKVYEQRNKDEYKYFQEINDLTNEDIKYKWYNNQDVENFILGYEVNCCARLNDFGEDIMFQTVINPRIKNLVIYNKDKIIGKATAFYNNDYILCNNVEVGKSYQHKGDLKLLLEALKRGLIEQAALMNDVGCLVNEIRIGMKNNDLEKELKEEFEINTKNLKRNYKFYNYTGDANSIEAGQAIIYKR